MEPTSRDQVILAEGLRGGAVLGLCTVLLAVLGLTPALRWIPEGLLLGAAFLIPVAILGWTAVRASSRTAGLLAGAASAAIAGAIGGAVGGLAYVVYGKSGSNIPVGLMAGAFGGAIVGLLAARFAPRSRS